MNKNIVITIIVVLVVAGALIVTQQAQKIAEQKAMQIKAAEEANRLATEAKEVLKAAEASAGQERQAVFVKCLSINHALARRAGTRSGATDVTSIITNHPHAVDACKHPLSRIHRQPPQGLNSVVLQRFKQHQ